MCCLMAETAIENRKRNGIVIIFAPVSCDTFKFLVIGYKSSYACVCERESEYVMYTNIKFFPVVLLLFSPASFNILYIVVLAMRVCEKRLQMKKRSIEKEQRA